MNAAYIQYIYVAWLVLGTVSFLVLTFLLVMFGKLNLLQLKIWLLARRGYHLVEHIGINKVRSYFFLKPKDNKFDFNTGFYLHMKDCVTKTEKVLPNTPSGWGFRKLDTLDDIKEHEELLKKIQKLVYNAEDVTLKWGIPIITYYGNSPYPVNFKEPEKVYSAQVIRDVYLRILATMNFKKLNAWIMYCTLAFVGVMICLVLLYFTSRSSANNTANCIAAWNYTQARLIDCVNATRIVVGNSTVVI